jgi:HPt (histidine-containing phosphotransfer) domain-containing protein
MQKTLSLEIKEPIHFKINSITDIVGTDPKVILRLLDELVKGCETKYASINTNFEKQAWNSVKNNAHFLKSNFRYLGNVEMMNILRNIELMAPDESKRNEVSMLVQQFNARFHNVLNEVKAYIQQLKQS